MYIILSLMILCSNFWSSTPAGTDIQDHTSCPSATNFTTSFSYPYSVLKEKRYQDDALDECDETADFSDIYRKHQLITSNTLRELMIRGFELLCEWTRPLKEKFKLMNHPNLTAQSFRIPDLPSETDYYPVDIRNLTVYQWPIQHEKLNVEPKNLRCLTTFKTTYEANSNMTTICGSLRINDTSTTDFALTYHNVSVTVHERKTRTQKGRILSVPIREEFAFQSCTAQSTSLPLHVDFVLDVLSPRLIEEIFTAEPSARLRYVSQTHNAKIAEMYKRHVLHFMCAVFVEYMSYNFSPPYKLPFVSNDTVELIIHGLDKTQSCGSNMQIIKRENQLIMKLIFSLNFPDESNDTVLVIQRSSPLEPASTVIKKLILRLTYYTNVEVEHAFHLANVSTQLVEKFPSKDYQKYSSRVDLVLGQMVENLLLTWILFENNY